MLGLCVHVLGLSIHVVFFMIHMLGLCVHLFGLGTSESVVVYIIVGALYGIIFRAVEYFVQPVAVPSSSFRDSTVPRSAPV